MGIKAIGLLRVRDFSCSTRRVEPLEDAVLLYTGADFADEPLALSLAVRALAGDLLDSEHDDPRGIFFIPDVVVPKARNYAGVIEEIGDGGVWGPLHAPELASLTFGGGAAGFEALLSGLLQQTPSSVLAAASAALQNNPSAMQAAASQLKGMLGQADTSRVQAMPDVSGIAALLDGAGVDLSSPSLQQLATKLQAELVRDPSQLAEFAERLFGEGAAGDHEDDADD
jgi:hypothetical protein